jgi:hypothetical protein
MLIFAIPLFTHFTTQKRWVALPEITQKTNVAFSGVNLIINKNRYSNETKK